MPEIGRQSSVPACQLPEDEGGHYHWRPAHSFVQKERAGARVGPPPINPIAGHESWQPTFIDYLFAAFSPTDTLIVTRRARALTMLQASIPLLTITIVPARGSIASADGSPPGRLR